MASAISRMRSLPAGFFMIQPMDATPYAIAASAQTSAKMSHGDIVGSPSTLCDEGGKPPRRASFLDGCVGDAARAIVGRVEAGGRLAKAPRAARGALENALLCQKLRARPTARTFG